MQSELERGRDSYATRSWTDAYEALSTADRAEPLGARDLELLAITEVMLGRDDDGMRALERAHQAHLKAGETQRAIYCAIWIGLNLATRGEIGPARVGSAAHSVCSRHRKRSPPSTATSCSP
jgi:hypothetical protein